MIKNKGKTKTILQKSPFMYYVTNWGFVEQPAKKKVSTKTNSISEKLTIR